MVSGWEGLERGAALLGGSGEERAQESGTQTWQLAWP